MIELPESATISRQATEELQGKIIKKVINATSPHRFTWYNGDPQKYPDMLVGLEIGTTKGYGCFVDICLDSDAHLLIGDGTNMRYYPAGEKLPEKFQLAVIFEDGSCLVFTVAMYGAIYAFKGLFDNKYYKGSIEKLSPFDERFDESFLERMISDIPKDISVKALLASEQRIPGLGNGVLQDILFRAEIHPKRKISTLNDMDKGNLFSSMKMTLTEMTDKGGRDTEKDLYGKQGGYQVLMSKNTYKNPCPVCGLSIVKEAYMGGAVYYCPNCQRIR